MAATTKLHRCFVEIFLEKKDFITFDFGYFAIVITFNRKSRKKTLEVLCGKKYEEEFLPDWNFQELGLNPYYEVISCNDFNEIEKACSWIAMSGLIRNEFTVYGFTKLCKLLTEMFQKHMKLFVPSPS